VRAIIFLLTALSFNLSASQLECENNPVGVKHVYDESSFVVISHAMLESRNETFVCAHNNDKDQCKNSTIKFSIGDFIKFKALGKEITTSCFLTVLSTQKNTPQNFIIFYTSK
jgi:hypothetical protein